MINPLAVTQYDRTTTQLQEFFIFCVSVAGKNAMTTSDAVERFMRSVRNEGYDTPYLTPFDYIRDFPNAIHNVLVAARVGQYGRIEGALKAAAESYLDLATCTLDDLEAIPGIGPKTARFFLLHTRPDYPVAVLDVHILRWLRENGFEMAPERTPQRRALYLQWERIALSLMSQRFPRGVTYAQADLLIWTQQSGRLTDDTPLSNLLSA